jgi:hypothetical protein
MPRGVYERSPELIKQLTETLVKWNKKYRKGRKAPKEIVEKQRKGHLRYYENHEIHNKNIPHKLETRKRISQGMKRYWNSKKGLRRRQKLSETMKGNVRRMAGKISNND